VSREFGKAPVSGILHRKKNSNTKESTKERRVTAQQNVHHHPCFRGPRRVSSGSAYGPKERIGTDAPNVDFLVVTLAFKDCDGNR
jgi:hypothetical protein